MRLILMGWCWCGTCYMSERISSALRKATDTLEISTKLLNITEKKALCVKHDTFPATSVVVAVVEQLWKLPSETPMNIFQFPVRDRSACKCPNLLFLSFDAPETRHLCLGCVSNINCIRWIYISSFKKIF